MKKKVFLGAIAIVSVALVIVLLVWGLGGEKDKKQDRNSESEEIVNTLEDLTDKIKESSVSTEESAAEEDKTEHVSENDNISKLMSKEELKEVLLANQTSDVKDIIDIKLILEPWDTKDTEGYSITQINSKELSFDENETAYYGIKEPGTYRIHCTSGKVSVGFGDFVRPMFEGTTKDGYSFVVTRETTLALKYYYSDTFILCLEKLSDYDWGHEVEIDIDNAFSVQEKKYFDLKDTVEKNNCYLCIDAIDINDESFFENIILGLHVSLMNGSDNTICPSFSTTVDGESIFSTFINVVDDLNEFKLDYLETGNIESGYIMFRDIPVGAKELVIKFYYDYEDDEFVEYSFDISEMTDLKKEIFENQ